MLPCGTKLKSTFFLFSIFDLPNSNTLTRASFFLFNSSISRNIHILHKSLTHLGSDTGRKGVSCSDWRRSRIRRSFVRNRFTTWNTSEIKFKLSFLFWNCPIICFQRNHHLTILKWKTKSWLIYKIAESKLNITVQIVWFFGIKLSNCNFFLWLTSQTWCSWGRRIISRCENWRDLFFLSNCRTYRNRRRFSVGARCRRCRRFVVQAESGPKWSENRNEIWKS